jgi:hypothetical protein
LPVRATGALLFADRGYHDLATSRCRGWNGFDLFLRAAFAATVAGANDDPRNALTKATSTNELDMCTHWSCVFSCCVHSLSLSLAYCFFVGGWIQHKLMEVERGHSWRGRAIFWASPLALARTARHTRVGRGNAHIYGSSTSLEPLLWDNRSPWRFFYIQYLFSIGECFAHQEPLSFALRDSCRCTQRNESILCRGIHPYQHPSLPHLCSFFRRKSNDEAQ